MRPNSRSLATLVFCLSLAPVAAEAWKAPPAGVVAIAEAQERAETGDYMVVEGVVTERRHKTLFRIEDGTGAMWVLIPGYVIRDEGLPGKSERIRVAGKYDRKKIDKGLQGVRVMTLWRDGKVTGGRGEGSATGASAPTAKPKASATPPASPATNKATGSAASGSVIRPTASAEFVEKASAARKAWNVAIAELEEASGAYARALHQAGDDAQVDAAIRERNEAAEADVARAGKQIQTVVDEARRSGVSDDVMRLYIQMTTGSR